MPHLCCTKYNIVRMLEFLTHSATAHSLHASYFSLKISIYGELIQLGSVPKDDMNMRI